MINKQVSTEAAGFTGDFSAVIGREVCNLQFGGDHTACTTPPSLVGVHAGMVDVLQYRGAGEQWGGRDWRHIRADRADYYIVCLSMSAELTIRQNSSDVALRPGNVALVSTGRPFEAYIRPENSGDFFSALHVRVPGALLRPGIPELDDLCGQQLEIKPGRARMLLTLFDIALKDALSLSREEQAQLGGILADMIGNVALSASNAAAVAEKLTAHQRTLQRAKAYIAAHLRDQSLGPAQVAAHCGVSTRSLHSAFAAVAGTSLGQFIRESRLLGCREALRCTRLRHISILAIAGDWGFHDPSHFCRIYKARFGRTPQEERSGDLTISVA